jgi:hypothetical protein
MFFLLVIPGKRIQYFRPPFRGLRELLTAKIAENAKFRKVNSSLRYFAFFAVKKIEEPKVQIV